jgi:hypothetical protein
LKNRLILIEGIPGSGKTTTAARLRDYLTDKGIKVKLYSEGDPHPADIAWNAYIPLEEYVELIDKTPEHKDSIKNCTTFEKEYALVAYTKLGLDSKDNELLEYFEAHEVYDGRVPLDTFKNLHLNRWKQFGFSVEEDLTVIFECAFLQNHVNELMGAHDKGLDYIINYMQELITAVKDLNPKLIYLVQTDTCETIRRVAEERVSPDKSRWPDWIDRVIKYIEDSQYGQKHGLKGFDGAIEFFESRKKIELAVIDKLPVDKAVINNPEYKWEEVFEEVLVEVGVL